MSRLRVNAFSVSLDGYGAGPGQDLENPLGTGGMALHQWIFGTKTFQRVAGGFAGDLISGRAAGEGVDDAFAARGFENIGAWIMGRNMFAPSRGPWADDGWKGWWGDEPPYHVPVFVLTRHARAPIEMKGGTTFYFVTDGIEAAISRAKSAAGANDVRLGGGVATVRACLQARLVDEAHLAFAPVLLGRGEQLLFGLDLPALGYRVTEHQASASATHVVLTRAAP
jgi:dihydrofolate reductase